MRRSIAIILSACAAGPAWAQHPGDIILGRSPGNQILTGRIADGDPAPSFPERIYLGEFGEGGLQPNFTNDPGFDTVAGTFSPGTRLTFTVRRALRTWDGDDFNTIAAETIRISFGPLGPVFTPLTDTPVTGFGVSVSSGGEFHNHYGYRLQAPASPGLYLLELEMAGDGGLLTSDPFWIIFEQPGSAFDINTAAEWVRDTYLDTGCAADLSGSSDPNDPAYGMPDGAADSSDFFYFLDQFTSGNLAVADLSGSSDPNDPAYGSPDGLIDAADFFFYLDLFVAGC